MTATLDKTSDSWFHDFVLENFGLTPFVNTFPDFMAGGAVMITALFIAAGMEVSELQLIECYCIQPGKVYFTRERPKFEEPHPI